MEMRFRQTNIASGIARFFCLIVVAMLLAGAAGLYASSVADAAYDAVHRPDLVELVAKKQHFKMLYPNGYYQKMQRYGDSLVSYTLATPEGVGSFINVGKDESRTLIFVSLTHCPCYTVIENSTPNDKDYDVKTQTKDEYFAKQEKDFRKIKGEILDAQNGSYEEIDHQQHYKGNLAVSYRTINGKQAQVLKYTTQNITKDDGAYLGDINQTRTDEEYQISLYEGDYQYEVRFEINTGDSAYKYVDKIINSIEVTP